MPRRGEGRFAAGEFGFESVAGLDDLANGRPVVPAVEFVECVEDLLHVDEGPPEAGAGGPRNRPAPPDLDDRRLRASERAEQVDEVVRVEN